MQVVEQVDSSRGQSFFRSLDLIIDLFASGTCYVLSERRARGVGKRVVTGTRPKPDKSEHEIPRNILLRLGPIPKNAIPNPGGFLQSQRSWNH